MIPGWTLHEPDGARPALVYNHRVDEDEVRRDGVWCDELIIKGRDSKGGYGPTIDPAGWDALRQLVESAARPCELPVTDDPHGFRCTRPPAHDGECEWRATSPHADRLKLRRSTPTDGAAPFDGWRALVAAVTEVRRIHARRLAPVDGVPAEHVYCAECRQTWPCATVQALGPEST